MNKTFTRNCDLGRSYKHYIRQTIKLCDNGRTTNQWNNYNCDHGRSLFTTTYQGNATMVAHNCAAHKMNCV